MASRGEEPHAPQLEETEEYRLPGAAPVAPVAPKKTSVLGDFRLVAVLGSGAMGTVYRARQISTPGDVALKVLSRDLAAQPAFVQRFLREGRLMARLEHPHVIRCYAVGASHGYHYLAQEYAGGGSVQSWLEQLGRFEVADVLCVALGCARGLQYAHGQHLVHRDVKPDNLLFSADGVVKLADLGLARATDDDVSLTRTGVALGTPLYAAPEQCRDAHSADARCDLYALGGVLYHLLAGRPPFEAGNVVELLTAKERGVFTPLRRLRPEVPAALERVVGRLLARLPEQRYQDCGELIEDLGWQGPMPEVPGFFGS